MIRLTLHWLEMGGKNGKIRGVWGNLVKLTRAGSLNHLAMPLQLLPIKQGSLNHFPETPREILEDHWHC